MREQRRVKWHLNLRRHPSKQHGPGGAGRIKKIVKSIAQKSCRKTITLPRYSLSTPRAQNLEMCNKPFWQLKWSQMCSCICRWVFGFKTGCKLRHSVPFLPRSVFPFSPSQSHFDLAATKASIARFARSGGGPQFFLSTFFTTFFTIDTLGGFGIFFGAGFR